jgi:hypothetical protein
VAILHAEVPEDDFGAFETLSILEPIHELAHEFSDHLELMPYQQLGKQVELSLAVYLRPVFADGRIIAIVGRDEFPDDLKSLAKIVETGIHHLDLLNTGNGQRYEAGSIESASQQLKLLLAKINRL